MVVSTQQQVPAEAPAQPRLRVVVAHIARSLLVANVVPAAIFYACLVTVGMWVALVSALVWCYGVTAWRIATGRRMSGLLGLMAVILTVRTAFALASGDTYWYFLQPVATDALVAAVLLVSLASAQPVIARMAGDFYPMSADIATRPGVRRLFRRLTIGWAGVCAAKSVVALWLLQSQSVATFVLAKEAVVLPLTVLAVVATVVVAAPVARTEGLLHQA